MRCSGKLAHDLLCSTLPEMWLFCHTRMPRIMLRSFAHQLRLNDEQREAMYRNYCIQGVTGCRRLVHRPGTRACARSCWYHAFRVRNAGQLAGHSCYRLRSQSRGAHRKSSTRHYGLILQAGAELRWVRDSILGADGARRRVKRNEDAIRAIKRRFIDLKVWSKEARLGMIPLSTPADDPIVNSPERHMPEGWELKYADPYTMARTAGPQWRRDLQNPNSRMREDARGTLFQMWEDIMEEMKENRYRPVKLN